MSAPVLCTAVSLASQAGREAPGLVSYPTSDTRAFRPSTAVEAAALRTELGAIKLEPERRRLSMLRLAVGFSARAQGASEKGYRSDRPIMVTLTYRGVDDWRPNHIATALKAAREWCRRAGCAFRYVWVAELQKRGAVHYHVCVWLPRHLSMPKWDKRGWWPHGMTNVVRARHAVGYLLKYISKGAGDALRGFPKGARIYGVGGLDAALRRARRWLRLPAFVRGNSDINDDWRRAPGGGWTAPDGRHWASEFVATFVGDSRGLLRVVRHAVMVDFTSPFSWLSRSPRLGGRSEWCLRPVDQSCTV